MASDAVGADGPSQPGTAPASAAATPRAPPAPVPDLLGDLLDLGTPSPAPAAPMPAGSVTDLLGGLELGAKVAAPAATVAPPPAAANLPVLLATDKGKGVGVRGELTRSAGRIVYKASGTTSTRDATLLLSCDAVRRPPVACRVRTTPLQCCPLSCCAGLF